MRTTRIALALALATLLSGCKKDNFFNDDNLPFVPPMFYYIIADNAGHSLLSSLNDDITVSLKENGQQLVVTGHYKPFAPVGATTPFLVGDNYMADKSVAGTKTFYLTFQGKTDTLSLDIHRVPATADNGGHSFPVVSFNGRPMQSVPGGKEVPDYFVLKRR